ncbi:MAG: TRAP transporter large permease [Rhodobacteraceae bacterium]|nr:TRAP transporter large permease [Paracoccaceae bacterium]
MTITLFLALFFVLLALGVPIYLVLGSTAMVSFIIDGKPLIGFASQILDNLNSQLLMAIPFFVLAAAFMQRGGIARVLIDVADVWAGWLPGGLGVVCVAACTVFAAISGSSVATALAMGTILIPEMVKRGYPRPLALGVVGASGTLGILIPPSLALLLYALIAEESVQRLFLAGVIPGLLQAGLFAGYIMVTSKRKDLPRRERPSFQVFLQQNLRALPALSLPVVILGGIYSGIVTISEAAALSALIAFLLSVFVYRQSELRETLAIAAEGMKSAASIMIIVATALVFGHWVTESGAPELLIDFAIEQDLKSWQFLLVINVLLLVLGMFLEVASVLLITLPLLLPLLGPLGINPIHFGIIMTVNMELALITPPVGLNLYVLSSITDAGIGEIVRGILPFIGLMALLVGLITYVPDISLWFPSLFYEGIR